MPVIPRKQRFGIAEWLNIAQLAALIIGGTWAAFLFIKFDARDKEITHQKTELELQRLKAAPLRFDQDISIWTYHANPKGPSNELGVDYHYTITNTSSQKIKVALLVVHALLLPPQTLGTADFLEIPPIGVDKDSPWRRLVSKAYLADEEELPNGVVESKEGFTIAPTKGGGATGYMEPGETHWGTLTAIVRGQKSDYIGFSVDAFVRFSDNTERWITGDQHVRLVPGDYPGSPKAQAPPDKAPTGPEGQYPETQYPGT